ncbi:MAG TPA: ribonuclease P protein component [Thermotogaceae bacterium]|nr:ribonuclease P protein component [Thermotogota bacterium]HEW92216.1 ribonuclease P protein component [Thermotogaceae bacterium]
MKKDESFPRKHRLRLKRDFSRLRSIGKSISNDCLVLVYIDNDLGYCRVATTIKKNFGKAFLRNRFKRFVREIFRKNKMYFDGGYDLLIIPRKKLADTFKEIRFHEFERYFIDLLEKAEIWNK